MKPVKPTFEALLQRIAELESQIQDADIYKNSFDHTAVGMAYVSPEGIIKRVNSQFCKMIGYAAGELVNTSYQKISHPNDLAEEIKLVKKILGNGLDHYKLEKRYIHKKGHTFWAQLNISVIRKADGSVDYSIASIIDISKQKEMAEALEKSEEKYRRIFESAGDAIVVTDQKSKVIDVNPAFTEITGIPAHQIIGKTGFALARKFASLEALPQLLKLLNDMIAGKQTILTNFKFKDKYIEIITKLPGKDNLNVGILRDITEREAATRALHQREADLKALIESTKDAIWSVDKKYRILTVNSKFKNDFEKYYGVELKKGSRITDHVSAPEKAMWIKRYEKVLAGNSITEFQDFELESGKCYFEIRINPIFTNDKITGASVISTDITEQKNAELALTESEEKFKTIFELAPDAYYLNDLKGNFIDGNKQAEALLGYKKEELTGKNFGSLNLLKSNEIPKALASLAKNALGKNTGPEEYHLIRKDGKQIPVEIQNHPVALGGKRVVLGIARDITIRLENEKALRESEARFRLIFDNVNNIAVQGYHADGTVHYWNKASEDLYGYTAAEAAEKKLFDLIIPKQMVQGVKSAIAQMFKAGAPLPAEELALKRKNGAPVTVYSNHVMVQIPGKDAELYCIDIDLSERKKAEEKLQQTTARLKTIVSNFPNGVIFMFNKNRVYSYADGKILQDFNLSAADIIGKKIEEVFPPEVTDVALKHIPALFKGDNCYYEVTYNGRIFANWGTAVKNDKGEIVEGLVYAVDITNLKESERFAHAVANTTPALIYIYDVENQQNIYTNKVHEKYFDIFYANTTSLQYDNIVQLVHPDDFKRLTKTTGNMIANPDFNKFDFELRLKSKDGWRWMMLTVSVFRKNEQGKATHILGAMFDIDDRKRAEQSLKESETRFKALHNASFGGIAIHNKGLIIDYNRGLSTITGYSYQELIGMNGLLLAAEKSRKKVMDNILAEYEKPYEAIGLRKNGEEYPLRLEAKMIPYKGKKVRVVEFRDITEQKRAEDELINAKEFAEESEAKLVEAQELSHVGSFEYFVNTDTVIWSKELYNIFQLPHNLPAPKYSEQSPLYTAESFTKLDQAVQDCIQYGTPYEIELEIFTSGSSRKQIISKGKAIRDEDDNIIGCYGTALDITTRKKLETDLIKAKEKAEEADRLKSAFLANMSHEIRTPMSGIMGFTELLKEPDLTGEEKEMYLEVIRKSGERMLNTVNDIIDISKIDSGQMKVKIEAVNPDKEITSLYNFFKNEAENKGLNLKLINRLTDESQMILTDRNKLNSILTNLIKNAIKYTHQGYIEIKCLRAGDHLLYQVKDTGIGIPKNRIDAVFNRFEQADIADRQAYQGSGLGLSITKSYVEMLDGKIWVESEEDKGSVFSVSLPWKAAVTGKNPAAQKADEKPDQAKPVKLRIIVVEDDETSLQHLNIILEPISSEIINAASGPKALEAIKQNPDTDLILMDIKLPGMDGYTATKKIREFNKEVIIIAQTAYALLGDREKALEAGCNDYISKPIKRPELKTMISKFFKQL